MDAAVDIIGGLMLLAGAGDLLVGGAVALAERLHVSRLLIGLTIVAAGTSAPELVVSIDAALTGNPGLAIGNVVGSNIANILLILGLPAVIANLPMSDGGLKFNTFAMLTVSALFVALCFLGPLGLWQGLALLALLAGYFWLLLRRARATRAQFTPAVETIEEMAPEPRSLTVTLGTVTGGLIGLVVGAELTVRGATAIAHALGISDAVIGLSVVALGTSLPELATSMMAVLRPGGRRTAAGVAVGNAVGSNIFNIAAIMGLTACLQPVPVPPGFLRIDLWVMLGAAAALSLIVWRELDLGRWLGVLMLAAYGLYVLVLGLGLAG